MKKLSILTVLVLLISSFSASGEEIVLITRQAPKGEKITEKMLHRIYLKRRVIWEDGKAIIPVNLSPQHHLRELFSQRILKKNHRELVDYWNEQHFNGVNPPVVLESEEAVKIFVRQLDGAVGYISRKNLEPDLNVIYSFEAKNDQ